MTLNILLFALVVYIWLNLGALLIVSSLKNSEVERNKVMDVMAIVLPTIYVPWVLPKLKEKLKLKQFVMTQRIYDSEGKLIGVSKKIHKI